ncbi:TrkH family potassium uptake protein [Pelomicrobium sp. G1]|uniref:TrkH family potassium uptake protein n=1 Tax=unclassified Pelomicrobium TaxID=2815318 RepID=UPI003F768A32
MNRLLVVSRLLSLVIVIFGLTMLFPVLVSLIYDDDGLYAYIKGLSICLVAGGLLWLATHRYTRELQVRDGFLLVALAWLALPAVAAVPFMLHFPQLSFTDAYFEAVSGLTTTGATIFEGLDGFPPSINLWRGELQWLGGMGILVLAVAILPLLGVGGSQIFKAETPGPMKDTKLTPRITETARGLWLVYFILTLACIGAYRLAGMGWLDAVIHAFTTLSLGGYSTHDASYGFFASPAIEAVTILFMLLAGLNFGSHFLAFRRLSFAPYRHDPELGWYFLVLAASCVGIALYLWLAGTYADFAAALRYAAFNTVSIATTTGYANTDYNQWPIFASLWMLFLASFVSCSGSTGSGIKMARALLLYKQVFREMTRIIHPQAVVPVKLGGNVVPNTVIYAVLSFSFLWMASVVVMTLLLSASGLEIVSAFTAVIACITNTGPGLNQVGPATNYASLTDFQTWVCSFATVLGRLELFTLFILLNPAFWHK